MVLAAFGAGFLAGGGYRQRGAGAATGPRKVLYHVDPMHPSFKSDKPGIAPDCGMRLEPVYEDEHEQTAEVRTPSSPSAVTVHVTPEKQQLIGVRVAAVERTAVAQPLRAYGRVVPDETRSYKIDVGIDGYIRELAPVTTGSQVRKDQWLATVAAPELRPAIQAYLVAHEIVEHSKQSGSSPGQIDIENASLQQSIDRLLTFGVSRLQLDEISRTRVVPSNIRITAPADGFVLSRSVWVGQKFTRGDELYRIADLRRVWILANLAGSEAERVPPGTIARVSVPGRKTSLSARVSTRVLPAFDSFSQALQLRLEADNPGYRLRPEMFVAVELPIDLPLAITVPVDAILDSGRETIAFVDRGEGRFEARPIRTGWRIGGRIEIVDGLREGEQVVVSGAFLLDSESRLKRADFDNGIER
jgi:membrane fusion protein, copper/silver efflux system